MMCIFFWIRLLIESKISQDCRHFPKKKFFLESGFIVSRTIGDFLWFPTTVLSTSFSGYDSQMIADNTVETQHNTCYK